MKSTWLTWAMRAFIGTVFVLCLFGPYGLSILIGAFCLGCYLFRDEADSRL
jgi:hypothetical protein